MIRNISVIHFASVSSLRSAIQSGSLWCWQNVNPWT